MGAYDLDQLAEDVQAIIGHFNAQYAHLIGHDWGGSVAWWVATQYPGSVKSLTAMAAGHPAVWHAAMRDNPEQRHKSWYVRVFKLRWLPERLMAARRYRSLVDLLRTAINPSACDDDDIAAHIEDWSRPGALTAMVNWYRAILRHRFAPEAQYRVHVPTLVIWGMNDAYGVLAVAARSIALCDDGRLEKLDASHWVQHDRPQEVSRLVLAFLARAAIPAAT